MDVWWYVKYVHGVKWLNVSCRQMFSYVRYAWYKRVEDVWD